MLHVRKGSGQGQCLHLSLTEENMQHDDVTSKNDVNSEACFKKLPGPALNMTGSTNSYCIYRRDAIQENVPLSLSVSVQSMYDCQ